MKKNKIKTKRLQAGFLSMHFIFFLFCGAFIVYLLIILNLKITHEKNGTNLEDYKLNQYSESKTLPATRGTIFDTNGEELASDIKVYDMYAILDSSYECFNYDEGFYEPCYVEDAASTAQALADTLELDSEAESFIEEQLNKEDTYQVEFGKYGKNLSLAQKEAVEALKLNGVMFKERTIRYYPYGDFASYIIGYAQSYDTELEGEATDSNLVGEMGIERALNGYLDGIDGSETTYTDANGVRLDDIPGIPDSEKIIEPQEGTDVYLTIDSTIQSIVENEIKNAYGQHPDVTTDLAFTIVMDAKNGNILAAYKEPSFDPNVKDISDYQNPFTDFCYEPGSTMKTITIATAYENGVWDDTGTYPSGSRTLDEWGGYTISDWKTQGWGNITFAESYYVSANTVTTMIQERIGNDVWDEYTIGKNGFGFGQPVETEFIQTASCDFSPTYQVEYATSSFGQGVTVNALQMLRAYTAFTNGGLMVTPHIVSQITDSQTGDTVYDDDSLKSQDVQVISPETASFVLEQMSGVVNYQSSTSSLIHGSGNKYQGSEYPIGTKTGTAEYTNGSSEYVAGTYIQSTMNVAPVDDPQIIIYTIAKDPSSSIVTGEIMPQYVKNITDKTLSYMNSENNVETVEIASGDKTPNYMGQNIDEVSADNTIKIGTGAVKFQYPQEGQNITSKVYVVGDLDMSGYDFTNKSIVEAQVVCSSQGLVCEYNGTGNIVESVEITDDNKYILTLKWS